MIHRKEADPRHEFTSAVRKRLRWQHGRAERHRCDVRWGWGCVGWHGTSRRTQGQTALSQQSTTESDACTLYGCAASALNCEVKVVEQEMEGN